MLATLALERLFDPVGFVILLVYGVIAFELPPRWRNGVFRQKSHSRRARAADLVRLYVAKVCAEAVIEAHEKPKGIWGKTKAFFVRFAADGPTARERSPFFLGPRAFNDCVGAPNICAFQFAAEAAHVSIPAAGTLRGASCDQPRTVDWCRSPGNVEFSSWYSALATEPFGVPRNDAIAVSLLIQTLQILR